MIHDNFPIRSSILKSLATNILHLRQGLHIKLFIRSWVDRDVEADVASEQMRPGSSPTALGGAYRVGRCASPDTPNSQPWGG